MNYELWLRFRNALRAEYTTTVDRTSTRNVLSNKVRVCKLPLVLVSGRTTAGVSGKSRAHKVTKTGSKSAPRVTDDALPHILGQTESKRKESHSEHCINYLYTAVINFKE